MKAIQGSHEPAGREGEHGSLILLLCPLLATGILAILSVVIGVRNGPLAAAVLLLAMAAAVTIDALVAYGFEESEQGSAQRAATREALRATRPDPTPRTHLVALVSPEAGGSSSPHSEFADARCPVCGALNDTTRTQCGSCSAHLIFPVTSPAR